MRIDDLMNNVDKRKREYLEKVVALRNKGSFPIEICILHGKITYTRTMF